MATRFTSVIGYHMNPMTCGVAKFNAELAKRLGVPFLCLTDDDPCFPLYSLKCAEMSDLALGLIPTYARYGVFWHDKGDPLITQHATVKFYADPSLGSPGLWCPSLLTPSKPRVVKLFSLGMAHKIQTHYYEKVKRLLDAAGLAYHLRVSVGLHEGTSLSDATKHFDTLKEILGSENVTILGILSDDAVVEEFDKANEVLAFFQDGLRDNNTTVHAALKYGKRVITNHDRQTGDELARRTIDINGWSVWPSTEVWDWDQLISEMGRLCERSKSALA